MIRARRAMRARLGPTISTPPIERIGAQLARIPAFAAVPHARLGAQVVTAAAGSLVFASALPGWRAASGAAVGLWGGWKFGASIDSRAGRSRADARAMPDLLDRLTLCVASGMSLDGALRVAGARTAGPIGAAIQVGLNALDAGVSRTDAYERIAHAAGTDDVAELVAVIARAESFGTPVADSLHAFATDLRARERAAAEAEARTAPVKLIFPLVFCFLPAFVLLTIAPIALSAVRTLGGL